MSFLKKFLKPERACTVCGEVKKIDKQLRDNRGHYFYCKECYEKTKKNIQQPTMAYVMKMKKEGKKISIEDVKKFSDELAKKQNLN